MEIDIQIAVQILCMFCVGVIYAERKHTNLLLEGPLAKKVNLIFVLLAIFGVLYLFSAEMTKLSIMWFVALLSPLVHSALFRAYHSAFLAKHGRPPENVAFNFKTGLIYDRVFSMVVICGFMLASLFAAVLINEAL